MSWHYSQAQVEEFWGDNFWDGEPFVQSNKNPTASAYCSKDKMTRFSRLSRFGMTFAPLTESRGKALLTWFLEGFHAPTSQLQAKEQELKEKKVGCGQKWRGSLAKYDPSTHSLKTAQCSLLEDSTQYSVTLPSWGLMLDGELLEQTMSEQITKENASGLSQETWPTPRASSAMNDKKETCLKRIKKRGYEGKLEQAVTMWPTPTASAGGPSKNPENPRGKHGGNPLATAVQMWPTPSSRDHKGGYQGGRIRNGKVSRDTLDVAVQYTDNKEKTGGQLCPIFVEYLMGWPLGHTDLKPLEMDKYQKWLELHGKY